MNDAVKYGLGNGCFLLFSNEREENFCVFFLISKYLNVKEVHEDLGIILIQKDAVASARTIPQMGRQTDTGSETTAGCPNGG